MDWSYGEEQQTQTSKKHKLVVQKSQERLAKTVLQAVCLKIVQVPCKTG